MTACSPLGIIAGEGKFPHLVAEGAREQERSVVAVGFQGHTAQDFREHVDDFVWIRIGQLGRLITFLRSKNCRDIVFAGAINKPKALTLRPDWRAAKLLFHNRNKNDNALLSALKGYLEQEGFQVLAPSHFVEGLSMPAGVLSSRKPGSREAEDIAFGWPLVKQCGGMDIGQCIAVRQGMVVAVEAMEGTNGCILRAGELAGKGCVILKAFKPGQEQHIDQPAIGVNTVRAMIDAGATCLAVEAGKSLFFDQEQALALANKNKVCVVGCDQNGDY